MHFVFILYGMKDCVDKLIRDMQAQKHAFRMYKEGQPDKILYIESQIRYVPFGLYEYVFPKEDLDVVLNSLLGLTWTDESTPYGISKFKQAVIRKMVRVEPIPEFKKELKFLWMKNDVAVIPIGIRHDGEIIEPEGNPNAG